VGTITFTTFWSSNQILTQGEQLATVVPSGKTSIIARAIIPTSALGKVVAGQQVNIKLSSFPYMEFGILSGIIRNISLVPIKDGYIVEIDLTKGMISNYSEKLKFVEQMDGTAEIITGDSRLISRFIRPLKNILNN
jgi:HlyD family secretion protein